MSNLFIEEKYNALYQAMEEYFNKNEITMRNWNYNVSIEEIVVPLVDKLEELGYIIIKK